jgi:hypothetical protein
LVEKWKLNQTSHDKNTPEVAQLGPGNDIVLPEPSISQVKPEVSLPEPVIIPQPEIKPEEIVLPEPVVVEQPEPEVQDTVLPEPVIPEPVNAQTADADPSGNCSGCGRKAMPDLEDKCMFCGHHLGGTA